SGQSNSLDGDVDGNHDDFDAWILKTDLSGNPVWNQSYGGTANDGASPLAFTNNGGVIFTGWTSSVDGDITTALGSFDYWVVNLAPVLSVSEVATFEMSVVPNPFSMSFQVHFQEFTSGTLTVFDMTGKRVSNIPVSGKSAVLESGAWQTGYYFLRFDQADGKQHGRLILKK
ncbi:MAG: T9SS type A sorting domain-containing protein, partial [Sphingobacteriales bacterium]